MIKVDWLAAFLLIPSKAGLINYQICQSRIYKFSGQWKARACCPENEKQMNFNQTYADNQVSRSEVRINHNKY
jgi:hypothetical protein